MYIYIYYIMEHIITNPHNKENNILTYTNEQFNKDLEKWFNETKAIQNDKVNTIIDNIIDRYK